MKFIREAKEDEPIVTAQFIYRYICMAMEHNYLCAVCREKKAVIECWSGILQPCWGCQKEYKVVRLTWIDKLLGRTK
jgi:hypothetical protein